MKTYEVYHGHEAVKRGFSWPAFFFGGFWLLSHRLWLHSAVFFIGGAVVSYAAAILEDQGSPAVALLLRVAVIGAFVVVGTYGNRWRVRALIRRGYSLVGEASAKRGGDAIYQAVSTPAGPTQTPSDTIGTGS